MMLVGDVKGKTVILIDDMADTAFTISKASKLLAEVGGATRIIAIVSHGILSGDAVERIKASRIDELIVSDSVPQSLNVAGSKGLIKVLDVAPLFAEAIRRIHNGESVSFLYDERAI
jgi:ribose-phosphate pyrophosphokinase